MKKKTFESRKRDHIRLALEPRHQARGLSGLDRIQLVHEALPELDLAEVSLATRFGGQSLATPYFIAAITAGHKDAAKINQALAVACQSRGWIFGLGSMRRDLEAIQSSISSKIDHWQKLRQAAPRAVLLANIGLAQLVQAKSSDVRALVERVRAQALVVHLNALQEALQPEGTPSFKGGLSALERLIKEAGCPVIVKETGCGFSRSTLQKLFAIGCAAIDVSGRGGTHWGRIEGARNQAHSKQARASEVFADWGISTVDSVCAGAQLRSGAAEGAELWASGGVRSGLDAAKLLALGAERVGFAQPALEALQKKRLDAWMEQMEYELKVALFCTGSATVAQIRNRYVISSHEISTGEESGG